MTVLSGHLGTKAVWIRDRVIHRKPVAHASSYGGVYYDAAGEAVHVYASEAYTPSDAANQAVANFVGTLVHGPEISTVNIYAAPTAEVQAICSDAAVACYDPSTNELVYVGDGYGPDGTPPEEAITHEYGHHIANSRENLPWKAVDWGTKRWASYEGICTRYSNGEIDPGNEAGNYSLNAGEAFADSYRLLNGGSTASWQFDASFFPDATDFALIRQDVTQPYTWPGLRSGYSGHFYRSGARRQMAVRLRPTLDGPLTLSLKTSGSLRATAYFIDSADTYYVKTSGPTRVGLTCNKKALRVVVIRSGSGQGNYRVSYAAP